MIRLHMPDGIVPLSELSLYINSFQQEAVLPRSGSTEPILPESGRNGPVAWLLESDLAFKNF